jgi:hypothetical protein
MARSARVLAWGLAALLIPAGLAGAGPNGFDVSDSSVPADEILRGGPPRDGIPALDSPESVPASESPWRPEDRVVGVVVNGEARAYPIPLLVWHELVNDDLGGQPILVSYCPLCGSALVFHRRLRSGGPGTGGALQFGVSGLLYRSDLLMYDRKTDSLWSQIGAHAISGPLRGERLELLPSRLESWKSWRRRHPNTRVLSKRTGHDRDYERGPYSGYAESEKLHFPAPLDARYHPKQRTLGLRTQAGRARAYPLEEVERAGGQIEERFAGRPVVIRVRSDGSFDVEAPPDLEVIESYWFAWLAFHPDSTVFRAER